MPHISKAAIGLLQQSFHILPHPFCLTAYISGIHHFPTVVDTRRTGNEHLSAVVVIHRRSPLKADPILVSGIQVCAGIEIFDLSGL